MPNHPRTPFCLPTAGPGREHRGSAATFSRDRVTGPGTRHPPPPGGWRALARVDAAPPLIASTRFARLASGSGSFAGAWLLLAVDRWSWFCPSRRALRRARATSGAVSLRSTAPPADFAGRGGVPLIGDRSPTSPAPPARPRPARWPGPFPPIGRGYHQSNEEGEAGRNRRGGGIPLPRYSRRAARAGASRHYRGNRAVLQILEQGRLKLRWKSRKSQTGGFFPSYSKPHNIPHIDENFPSPPEWSHRGES